MPAFTNLLPTSMMSQWKATLEKQVSTGVNQLMSTASQSIVKSVNTWALSNSNSIKTEVDKALQPFLNSLKQQAISSLGSVSLPSNATSAAQGGSNTPLGASTNPQAMWDTLGKVLDSQKSIADSNKQIAKAISQLSGGTTPAAPPIQQSTPKMTTGGGGATRERSAGEESMIIAAMTETVHGLFEKMSEVRNEMYSTLIQGANLQRQLNFQSTGASSSPGDIRPFVNRLSQPGMEQGYTKQEAFDAAQNLAMAGGNQTNQEVIRANEEMVRFAGRRGFDITQWSQVMAGAETAGLFGGARGTQVGGRGIEEFQNKLAGMYQIASLPGGGSRGTTQNLDDFAAEVSNVSTVIGEATGNSENMTKAFQNMGKEQGNVFDLMTKFSQSNNLAVSGQGGVQTIANINQAIMSGPTGSPGMQALSAMMFPDKSYTQRIVQMGKGLGAPENLKRMMTVLNQQAPDRDSKIAFLMQNANLSEGQSESLLDNYGKKPMTEKQLKAAGLSTDQSDNSQAIKYRQALDSLTKSTEELASNIAPLIAGFDKLNGMLFGLPEIALGLLLFKKTLGDTTKETFEFAKSLFKGKEAKKAESEVEKLLTKGKGQPVYVTNECLRICGGGVGGPATQQMAGKIEGAAAAEAEGVVGGGTEAEALASMGIATASAEGGGLLAGYGGAAGVASMVPGGTAALAGGTVVAGAITEALAPVAAIAGAIAASPLLAPAAIVGGTIATGYAITHPKQAADFMGGVGNFAGQAIGGTMNAAGNVIGGTANALWRSVSALTTVAVGKDRADIAGGGLKGTVGKWFGERGDFFKEAWRGIEKSGIGGHIAEHVGDAFNRLGHGVNRANAHGGGLWGFLFDKENYTDQFAKGMGELDPHPSLKNKKVRDALVNSVLDDTQGIRGGGGHMAASIAPEHAEEVKKHIKASDKIRLDHLKATNEQVEKVLGFYLDKTHPLEGQAKSDLTTNAVNFLKNIGVKVVDFFKKIWSGASDWWSSTFGSRNKSDTSSGGGGDSGAGGGSGDSYGYNTFSNYRISATQGTNIGPTSALKDDIEAGNVYAPGVGAQVKLPQGARYNAKYSTKYNSMFTLPDGRTISIMHIDANRYKDNQYVRAGTSIGTVTTAARGASGGSYGDTNSYGFEFNQSSDSGVFEADVYDTARHAADRTPMGQGQYNFSDYLASLKRIHTGGGGPGGSPLSASIGGMTASSGVLKSLYNASKKYGVPLPILLAVARRESGLGTNETESKGMGRGLMQFDYSSGNLGTIKKYLGTTNMSAAYDDSLSAMGGAHYLNDLYKGAVAKGYKGNQAWEATLNAYNSGSYNLAGSYGADVVNMSQNAQIGYGAGGGSGQFVSLKPEPIKVEIDLRYPDGTLEKIVKTAKFQGVAGIHVQHNAHKMAAHHANKRTPRR